MIIEKYISISEIIELIEQQEPTRQDIILGLLNCVGGQWRGRAYYQFVDSTNANQFGAEWQFEDSLVVEHPKKGTIIIDKLKDNRIGGIEFYNLI
jgi:hypothetical protein